MEIVDGKHTRIRFDGTRCIHSRACVLSQPAVFKANVQGPWIDPDAASPEELLALAERCPSGAIAVERLDGGAQEQPSGRNVVAVLENGPYAVRGDLQVGGAAAGTRATLCRCGASKRKPFCDGSHHEAGFTATGEFPPPASLPDWGEPGPLSVQAQPDGPLRIEGAHEVTCGTGRAVKRGTRAFLCRCGASGNKPFCDGTHTKVGFTAPGS
ncbi:MAG: CDGSH iron-sulfur domain-containing protein [Alphaproteobacteria bacterium]|nr:CDGSH iron-sulfur domain-containing protein [Alphaproteobacteria bacterium]